jgi:PAS domain S-box-containing protein
MTTDTVYDIYCKQFEEISAAVFMVEPSDGAIVGANSEAEELTGYEKSELKGMNFANIFVADDQQRIGSLLRGVFGEFPKFGKLYEHNVIIQKRSKRYIIVDIGFKPLRIGDHQVYIFTLQDITDLKHSEQSVTRANQYVNAILSSMIEALVVIDEKGVIKTINPATCRLLGYAENELIAQNISTIVDQKDDTHRNLPSLLQKGGLNGVEMNFCAKSGNSVPVLISASKLRSSNTVAMHHTVIVAKDLTEKRRAEAMLAEQQMALIQASKLSSLGEMASGIAHEINNPLLVLQGQREWIEVLLGKNQIKVPEIDAALKTMEKMGDRIEKIVKGLRTFSRDQRNVEKDMVGIEKIVCDTLDLCAERMKNHGVTLDIGPIAEDMRIYGNGTQISQVLLNLINNAFDACHGTKSPCIKVEFWKVGSHVYIAVINNGPQIPDAIAARIFEPFFTTKPVGKGTGLGLSISKSIISEHGGEIHLDRRLHDTRFIVKLPEREVAVKKSA